MRRRNNYRYRPNRVPIRLQLGNKVLDDVSGAVTRAGYTVVSDFGEVVDARRDTFNMDRVDQVGESIDRQGRTEPDW